MSRSAVREALGALGIRRLLLSIHDASLPADASDDLGRGAPLSRGAAGFLQFASDLGFDGLQLGPQGETSDYDPSPYDATLFGRGSSTLAPLDLVERGLLLPEELAALCATVPPESRERAQFAVARRAVRRALEQAWPRAAQDPRLAREIDQFSHQHQDWLRWDELSLALAQEHCGDDWSRWPRSDQELPSRLGQGERAAEIRRDELLRTAAPLIARHRFAQFLAHQQHQSFRERARELGLSLFGDLQIGVSHQDLWAYRPLFLDDYRMGAPPSRTNPEGQPWGYAVLDPAKVGTTNEPGPALRWMLTRAQKLFAEFDGLRIDHPHGLVDPWVYLPAPPHAPLQASLSAVQAGARLRSSPDLPDHPRLSPFSVVRPDQLDRSQARFADGWVQQLDEAQIDAYGRAFEAIALAAERRGLGPDSLAVEVLSTLPYPLRCVLARRGLGQFRVTQKVRLDDATDVYRSENAWPQDWIMVGNHDTETIWSVAERWVREGQGEAHAAYLADRLRLAESARAAFIESAGRDPRALARAKLAELFLGPARQVSVFFADLLGMTEPYNRPGTVDPANWTLRVPPDYREEHQRACRAGRALDLRAALATALAALPGRPRLDPLRERLETEASGR